MEHGSLEIKCRDERIRSEYIRTSSVVTQEKVKKIWGSQKGPGDA